jgi:hypothetical protein
VRELSAIADLNIGITALGGSFTPIERGPGNPNNLAQFNFRFGYDTVPNILISVSRWI